MKILNIVLMSVAHAASPELRIPAIISPAGDWFVTTSFPGAHNETANMKLVLSQYDSVPFPRRHPAVNALNFTIHGGANNSALYNFSSRGYLTFANDAAFFIPALSVSPYGALLKSARSVAFVRS